MSTNEEVARIQNMTDDELDRFIGSETSPSSPLWEKALAERGRRKGDATLKASIVAAVAAVLAAVFALVQLVVMIAR